MGSSDFPRPNANLEEASARIRGLFVARPKPLDYAHLVGGRVLEHERITRVQALRAAVTWTSIVLRTVLILFLLALTLALGAVVVPRAFGYAVLIVHGGSMGDAIPNGALVVARNIDDSSVRVGDVIMVRSDAGVQTRPKLHRVTSVQADGDRFLVETKGDANGSPDPTLYILPPSVATPAYHIPYLGHLAAFVATPLGWLSVVLLPSITVAFLMLRSIWFPDAPRSRRLPRGAVV